MRIAAVSWTLLVAVGLLLPGDNMPDLGEGRFPDLPEGTDKVVHAVLFAVETFFLSRWLRAEGHSRPLAVAVLLAAGLAVVTELLQVWIPHRTADPADFLANQVGVALSAGWIRCFSPGQHIDELL